MELEPLPNLIDRNPEEAARLEDVRRKLFYFPPARTVKEKTVQIVTTTAAKTNPLVSLYARYYGKRNQRDISFESLYDSTMPLDSSLTAHQANALVDLILDRAILARFRVLELRALVGTTTLALLDHTLPGADQVISVRAVETNSSYLNRLKEIIEAYGFRDASRINYSDRVESFNDAIYQGQIAIVHPDPDNTATSEGLLITNLVRRMLDVFSLVAVAGPTKMFERPLLVGGFVPEYVKLDDLDRARVAIFKSEIGENKARERELPIKATQKTATSDWKTELKAYLTGILPLFGVNKDDIPKYLSEQPTKAKGPNESVKPPMEYWVECFTHESVDPKHNYEDLENYGDAVLKAFFSIYLHKKIPGLNKRTATELHQQYMSKFRQPDYADKLDLANRDHYRINPKNNNEYRKSKEDLFEAFTAALFQISDSVLSTGQGERKILLLLEYIFSDTQKYNWKKIVAEELSQPRTQLKQRIDKIYMREGHRTFEEGNSVLVEIFIKGHDAVPLLRQYGINLPSNKIISYSSPGTDETKAVTDAYEAGLRYMDSIRMTDQRLTEIQHILQSVDPAVADMQSAILNAKSLLNLEALYFLTDNIICMTKLIGVHKGAKREHFPLAQVASCNGNASKRDVMRRWLAAVLPQS